jgi:stress-induced morphogen
LKIEELIAKIEMGIRGSKVTVIDLNGNGDHFSVIVVSEQFSNMTLIARHKLVNNCLKEELKGPIHALALKTFTSEEYSRTHIE